MDKYPERQICGIPRGLGRKNGFQGTLRAWLIDRNILEIASSVNEFVGCCPQDATAPGYLRPAVNSSCGSFVRYMKTPASPWCASHLALHARLRDRFTLTGTDPLLLRAQRARHRLQRPVFDKRFFEAGAICNWLSWTCKRITRARTWLARPPAKPGYCSASDCNDSAGNGPAVTQDPLLRYIDLKRVLSKGRLPETPARADTMNTRNTKNAANKFIMLNKAACPG